jgi:hypothetical protein
METPLAWQRLEFESVVDMNGEELFRRRKWKQNGHSSNHGKMPCIFVRKCAILSISMCGYSHRFVLRIRYVYL